MVVLTAATVAPVVVVDIPPPLTTVPASDAGMPSAVQPVKLLAVLPVHVTVVPPSRKVGSRGRMLVLTLIVRPAPALVLALVVAVPGPAETARGGMVALTGPYCAA